MELKTGTRVMWTDPDGGARQYGTVAVDFDSEESESVFITTDAGGELGALPEELTLLR